MTSSKLPIHKLPLPSRTLQSILPQLNLESKPSAQRRSTTFSPTSEGIWARVLPLWTSWPLSLTKDEVEEMGVDINAGGRVDVEAVLRRWDPVEESHSSSSSSSSSGEISAEPSEEKRTVDNGLKLMSSAHRRKVEPILLGVSALALKDSLPHLDVGIATELCQPGTTFDEENSPALQSLLDVMSGREVVMNNDYGPWSTRYCGHQFGVWAGQLGDGRAISLLETVSAEGGRQEIQLKGAGRTPFSRTADGLAVLRSGIREYLGCESVAALGIPTTRSLAIITTNPESLPVIRENGPEPASLVARLAPSFIRVGHFEALNPGESGRNSRQFFMGSMGGWNGLEKEDGGDEADLLGGQGNLEGLLRLTNWVKDDIMSFEGGIAEWAKEVVRRNAEMVAGWQVYGFMHGVLNTDNISVLGLTIDYGPYAFMDVWDDNHICNHSDPSGLYSYRNQPSRVLFALDSLMNTLLPLIGYELTKGQPEPGFTSSLTRDEVKELSKLGSEVVQGWDKSFWEIEREAEMQGWMKRFGLQTKEEGDGRLVKQFLAILHSHGMDFHTSLRTLSELGSTQSQAGAGDAQYLANYIENLISISTTSIPPAVRSKATSDLGEWLKLYTARITLPEEKRSWEAVRLSNSQEDIVSFGPVANPISEENEDWESKRLTAMKRVNPRFVLRQWVLEETISKLEKMQDVTQARQDLAKILDMATRPFYPWGEDGSEEDARLCGLGSKSMLGFQCSCSS